MINSKTEIQEECERTQMPRPNYKSGLQAIALAGCLFIDAVIFDNLMQIENGWGGYHSSKPSKELVEQVHKVREELDQNQAETYRLANPDLFHKTGNPHREKSEPSRYDKTIRFIKNAYTQVTHRGKVKNNNPCNLKAIPGKKWAGQIGVDHRGFAIFKNDVYGLRSWLKNLEDLHDRYNLDTVHGFISKCSPPHENDTNSYIRFVAQNLGVSPHERLDLDNKEQMVGLLNLVTQKESSAVYSRQILEKAYAMVPR